MLLFQTKDFWRQNSRLSGLLQGKSSLIGLEAVEKDPFPTMQEGDPAHHSAEQGPENCTTFVVLQDEDRKPFLTFPKGQNNS